MITKFILSALVAFMMSAGLMTDRPATPTPDAEQRVRALQVDGEVFPHISLPVVEITGDLDRLEMVKADWYEGEMIPSYDLPEVIIQPSV